MWPLLVPCSVLLGMVVRVAYTSFAYFVTSPREKDNMICARSSSNSIYWLWRCWTSTQLAVGNTATTEWECALFYCYINFSFQHSYMNLIELWWYFGLLGLLLTKIYYLLPFPECSLSWFTWACVIKCWCGVDVWLFFEEKKHLHVYITSNLWIKQD